MTASILEYFRVRALKKARTRADDRIMSNETRVLLHGAAVWVVLLALFLVAWAGASIMKRIGWMR